MADKNNDDVWWKRAELLFGGGVIVWALTSGIAGIWWAATVDSTLGEVSASLGKVEERIDRLDNAVLGNRLTAVETRVGSIERGIASVDGKLDRILLRQLGGRERGDNP